MSVIRQDAWTDSEDMMLAEVVLRHIREGSTQLSAFEEVGSKLKRSAAACGFRWNSLIRKKYNTAVEMAKKQRKELKKKTNKKKAKMNVNQGHFSDSTEQMTMEKVIAYLSSLNNDASSEKFKNDNDMLMIENERLKKDLQDLHEKYQSIQKDYRSLLDIMNRARQMIVVNEDNYSQMESVKK
jgi:prespore-specific regulator